MTRGLSFWFAAIALIAVISGVCFFLASLLPGRDFRTDSGILIFRHKVISSPDLRTAFESWKSKEVSGILFERCDLAITEDLSLASEVQYLQFENCRGVFSLISHIHPTANLRSIRFSASEISGETLVALREHCAKLHTLYLETVEIDRQVACQLIGFQGTIRVVLDDCLVDWVGACQTPPLSGSRVGLLSISNSSVTEDFFGFCNAAGVATLQINECEIPKLEEIVLMEKITSLTLSQCMVSAETVGHLLHKMPNLNFFGCANCGAIDDAIINYLMRPDSPVTSIHFQGEHISPSLRQKLKTRFERSEVRE